MFRFLPQGHYDPPEGALSQGDEHPVPHPDFHPLGDLVIEGGDLGDGQGHLGDHPLRRAR